MSTNKMSDSLLVKIWIKNFTRCDFVSKQNFLPSSTLSKETFFSRYSSTLFDVCWAIISWSQITPTYKNSSIEDNNEWISSYIVDLLITHITYLCIFVNVVSFV